MVGTIDGSQLRHRAPKSFAQVRYSRARPVPTPVVGAQSGQPHLTHVPAAAATLPNVGIVRPVQGQHRMHDPRLAAAKQPGSPPGRAPGRT